MNIGSRMSLWGSSSSKIPYVSDGLCAWWDGEWNQGEIGVHNAIAQDWVDLSERKIVLGQKSGSITVGDNFYASVNGTKSRLSNTTNKILLDANALTIEIVLDTTGITNGLGEMFLIRPTLGGYGIEFYSYLKNSVRCVYSECVNNNSVLISTYSLDGNDAPSTRYIAASIDSGGRYVSYINGQEQGLAGTLPSNFAANLTTCIGASIFAEYHLSSSQIQNYPGTCKIYCIRAYTRALTATEIASNYAADCKRFPIT